MKRRTYNLGGGSNSGGGATPYNNVSRPGSASDKRSCSEDTTVYHNNSSDDDWRIYAIVSVVAIAVYVNGLSGDFVHDDIPAITMNKDVLGLSPISNVFKNDFWGTPMADISSHKSYRPLTTLTFR